MNYWHHDAACANEAVDIWFDPGHERLALSICSTCPVLTECRDAALTEEHSIHTAHGIRGGLTPLERHPQRSTARRVIDHPGILHGSRSLYRKGCRCAACTDAQRAYHADWTQRRRAKAGSPEHGTRSRYQKGCRCDDCRAANTAYDRHLRNGGGLGV